MMMKTQKNQIMTLFLTLMEKIKQLVHQLKHYWRYGYRPKGNMNGHGSNDSDKLSLAEPDLLDPSVEVNPLVEVDPLVE